MLADSFAPHQQQLNGARVLKLPLLRCLRSINNAMGRNLPAAYDFRAPNHCREHQR